jgi:DNA-binding NarL/FixJ family response regulator
MTVRILIADDHSVVRNGLRDMLAIRPTFEVVGEADNGLKLLYLVQHLQPDLVILDITLPGMNGIEALQSLRTEGVKTPVLIFSMHPAEQFEQRVMEVGGQGFIGKHAGAVDMLVAIDLILGGKTYFPSLAKKSRSRSTLRTPSNALPDLSARERGVLIGIARGKAQVKIAEEMGISSQTVGTYRRRLLDKLGLETTADLIALATRLGMKRQEVS